MGFRNLWLQDSGFKELRVLRSGLGVYGFRASGWARCNIGAHATRHGRFNVIYNIL